MSWKVVFALLLLPFPALAECPTREDLAKGIIFASNAGSFVRHRVLSGGIIEMDTRFSDKSGNRMHLAHGLYPIESYRFASTGALDPASRHVFATEQTALGWPEPRAEQRWDMPGDGGGAATAGPATKIRWDNCVYDAIEVSLTFSNEPNYVEAYNYLPELGIGLLASFGEPDDPTRYRYTLISK